MKKLAILPLLFLPVFVSAHVKWFAHPEGLARPYSITDGFVISWIIISIVLVFIGVFLDKKTDPPKYFVKKTEGWTPFIHSLSSIGFGISLIIFTLKGFVFAPNFPAHGNFGALLLLIQGVSGLLMLFGFFERVGAILLLLAFLGNVYIFGFHEMIDALEMLGFSIYLFIVGRPLWRLVDIKWFQTFAGQIQDWGIPLLRVFTGLNLIALGFTEKILAPSMTQEFLTHYKWNFMQDLGFSMFTNYWFAFSAGVVEALFGIFLVLGLVTRLTTLVLAVFLAITLVLLGPIELMGHLPHFSIAIVFLVLGSGEKLKIVKS